MTKAIVLFSAGIDSTIALAWALRQGHEVTALEFDYPDRPQAERDSAQRLLHRLRPHHHVHIPLPFPLRTKGPKGYLATRNLAFHALAQSLAESKQAKFIVAGHLERDGTTFADARRDYFRSIEALAAKGRPGHRRIRILNPLIDKDREERVRLARRLNVPLELTWSCWHDGPAPCGACDKCRERTKLLRAAHPLKALRPRTARRPPRGSRASRR